jgi:hypothetical protein
MLLLIRPQEIIWSRRHQLEIAKIDKHGVEELEANMRKVGMLTDPTKLVYSNSLIELEQVSTSDIAPAQRYVLVKELEKVRDLRWALREHGVDLFKLDGYVTIWLEDCEDPIDVLPPVVEQSAEADGTVVKILNDGMHRVYLARMERSPIQVVYVRNIPEEYPYYAFPLVNGWKDVEMVAGIPEGYIKKWHRVKGYKDLYRDFNTGFQNVGGPRGHTTDGAKN